MQQRVPGTGMPAVLDGDGAERLRLRVGAADSIVAHLRSEIASQKLPLGARLPNGKALAEFYGVSQPTIREAVQALSSMGLVDVRHGSGVYVAANLNDSVASSLGTLFQVGGVGGLEALEMRQVLGVYSIRSAAANATPDDLDYLRAAARHCEEADSVRAMAQAVVWFQEGCSRAAHNPLAYTLESFLIRIWVQLQLVAEATRGETYWRHQTSSFAGHRNTLIEAIASADPDAAESAMAHYVDEQRSWVVRDDALKTATLSHIDLSAALSSFSVEMPK